MDFRIELIPLAVRDVDRSVEFYGKELGWSVDHDQTVNPELRFVQVTPPGSACSICFGTGLDMMPEGSSQFIQIVVADADEACAALRERGWTAATSMTSPGVGSHGSTTQTATAGRCSRSSSRPEPAPERGRREPGPGSAGNLDGGCRSRAGELRATARSAEGAILPEPLRRQDRADRPLWSTAHQAM